MTGCARRAWHTLRKRLDKLLLYTPSMTLSHNSYIPPMHEQLVRQHLQQRGLKTWGNLYPEGTFYPSNNSRAQQP